MADGSSTPLSEPQVQLAARVVALEYMLGEAFGLIYTLTGTPLAVVRKRHADILAASQSMPVATSDPAVSDLLSAELQQAYTALLRMIEDCVQRRESQAKS